MDPKFRFVGCVCFPIVQSIFLHQWTGYVMLHFLSIAWYSQEESLCGPDKVRLLTIVSWRVHFNPDWMRHTHTQFVVSTKMKKQKIAQICGCLTNCYWLILASWSRKANKMQFLAEECVQMTTNVETLLQLYPCHHPGWRCLCWGFS